MKPEIKAQLSRQDEPDDFDVKFWREAGPEARLRAMTELKREYYLLKGINPDAVIFRRDIAHLHRQER